MSEIHPAPPVLPFAAAFARGEGAIMEALGALGAFLGGGPDIVSPPFPVTETAYYEAEMGPGLVKTYASWPTLMSPEKLAGVKLAAMGLERARAAAGRRTVNVDPGYVFEGGLVLSTGKFRGHRLPLGQGVWGELTLHFHRGAFQAFPWTYRDYQVPAVQGWLLKMRRNYLRLAREGSVS